MPGKVKLSYERQTKTLDLMPKADAITSHINKPDIASSSIFHQLKGYEKTDGVMSYSIVCVISGGEKKERDFLRALIRQKDLHSLRVAFISKEGQGLQPYQMQEQWEEIQKNRTIVISDMSFQLDEMDKVFLLSDVDEFYEQLAKIIENQHKEDIEQWIISNPCFEMWLYYCFCNSPEEDLTSIALLNCEKRSQELKHLGHIVVEGGLNPIKAFERMHYGICNSIKHYAEDDKSIPVLYATQMHKMAQYLIDTMNHNLNEYDNFVKQKQEWHKKMTTSYPNKLTQK